MRIFTFFFLFLIVAKSFANIDYNSSLVEIRKKPDYVELIEKAQKGDPDAQKKIGDIYSQGDGVIVFPSHANYWYEKAGAQGNLTAQILVGDFYYLGEGGQKNYFLAKQWYEKAANQGNVRAHLSLGDLYSTGGRFLPKNNLEAKKWYSKACELGSFVGCNLQKSVQD